MNKKRFQEVLSGIGMVAAAFVMMFIVIGLIVLVFKVFHNFK